jgi:hypothetical protein
MRWLRKKASKEQQGQYSYPPVTSDPGQEYVTIQQYNALAEQVGAIAQSINVSQKPLDKLECPAEVLVTLPGVVKKTVEGVISNYENDFPDFCFWGMRKALIDAIRIRFQKDQKEGLLYDTAGNAYDLPKWIALAKQQRFISNPEAAALLEKVKVFGDTASYDYMANLQKTEVPGIFTCLRMALARMYYPTNAA